MRCYYLRSGADVSFTQPIYLSWHVPGGGKGWRGVDLLRAHGESLGFTDREIVCGLLSSSSCHCLFNSERHPLTRVGDVPDPA